MSHSADLPSDVVDVWHGRLDLDEKEMAGMIEFLSSPEQQRIGGLLEERAVRQYVVSRAMQRQILASYAGGSPADIRFGVVAMGKPTLAHPNKNGLTFNTTHSGSLVVIAVTEKRNIGVDMEKLRPIPKALQLAKRFFSDAEFRMLEATSEADRDRAFLEVWTRREGTAKARGDSVWRGLASWKNGEMENSPRQSLFTVRPLDVGQDFVGVVVAEGSDWTLRMRGEWKWYAS
ncbi:MAG TPA: 4'-phosphopantetheinyl transferase superfamily protein [Gemmatimonadaceae bacterium]|nr:4'-phosphopantetheinyl transferase superfamily protein [Gemmatimonadaceae bacterium]